MELMTVFAGGCIDSLKPSKVHIANEAGDPLCGQYFQHPENVDRDFIDSIDFTGSEACSKCVKKLSLRPNTQVQP